MCLSTRLLSSIVLQSFGVDLVRIILLELKRKKIKKDAIEGEESLPFNQSTPYDKD